MFPFPKVLRKLKASFRGKESITNESELHLITSNEVILKAYKIIEKINN